jgi:hypothetical protein
MKFEHTEYKVEVVNGSFTAAIELLDPPIGYSRTMAYAQILLKDGLSHIIIKSAERSRKQSKETIKNLFDELLPNIMKLSHQEIVDMFTETFHQMVYNTSYSQRLFP